MTITTGRDAQNIIKGLTLNKSNSSRQAITNELKKQGVNITAYAGRALSAQTIKKLAKAVVPAAQAAGVKISQQGKSRSGFEQLIKKRLQQAGIKTANKELTSGVDWLRAKVLKPAAAARVAAKAKVATTINTDKPQVSISDSQTRQARTSVFGAKPSQPETRAEKPPRPPVELAI